MEMIKITEQKYTFLFLTGSGTTMPASARCRIMQC